MYLADRRRKGVMKLQRICSVGLLLLVAHAAAGASTVMYRYVNEQGDPVYSYTLPADQAELGYQKVDAETGQILQDVAPQLPPEELAAQRRRERAMQECRDELERIYQLYGTRADIENALEAALSSLETRIGQLQANLRQARRQQERLRSQAADAERAGRQVPRIVQENLRRGRGQIETLREEIDKREEEKLQARARYAHELERFDDGTCPAPGTLADSSAARGG